MASYTTEWAGALQDITDAGSSVTFTRTRNIESVSTGLVTPIVTTISGYAIRVKGDPLVYDALKLIESNNPTLLFAPSTEGQLPRVGDTVTWGSVGFTLRDVKPIRPNGRTIIARLVIST